MIDNTYGGSGTAKFDPKLQFHYI